MPDAPKLETLAELKKRLILGAVEQSKGDKQPSTQYPVLSTQSNRLLLRY